MALNVVIRDLLSQIDFDKSEILFNKTLVFVCGGKKNGVANSPASMREALLAHSAAVGDATELGGSRILLAEEANEALAKSSFRNLLELEEYIAAVVDAVLLIVESAGSICELGAFVKTEEIRQKLIIVMPSEHISVPSFITKGPIKYIEDNYADVPIMGFHWTSGHNGVVSAANYTLEQMAIDIPEAIAVLRPTLGKAPFNRRKIGHKMYLIIAFCHLLRAAKLSDIKNCFLYAEMEIDEITIRRCLDTLVICKFIKLVTHGKLSYYVAQVARLPLDIRWKSGTPNPNRNTLRWIAQIASTILESEKYRLEMFQEHGVA